MTKINTKYNPENEISKYNFFEHLEHVKEKDPKTVDQYAKAIHEFEIATKFKSFAGYNIEWAKDFKYHLENKKNQRTGRSISKSLYLHYVNHVRQFLFWSRENFKLHKKIKKDQIEYLRVAKNDANKARAVNHQESYDVKDILSTIRNMPEDNILHKRNKAMISLMLLTCPRISSFQTSRIKSIRYFDDYDIWALMQDPKSHNTKYSKKIISFFIGQSKDIINNIISWRDYLMLEGFEGNDYLFPKIPSAFNKDRKKELTLSNDMIKSQTVIRDLFKEAFNNNNLPYIKPHNFRHSIARKAIKEQSNVDFLAGLQENVGPKGSMATLFASYGSNYLTEQARLMKSFNLE